jgi:hypothetical protein
MQSPVLVMRYGFTILPKRFGLPMPHSMKQVHAGHRFVSLLALLLTSTIVFAVGGMAIWQAYLVLTAQGTVDFHKNREAAANAARWGHTWRNVHDLGMARNWQERFDARGRFWMITWLLPRLAPHRGCGFEFPLAAGAEAYLGQGEQWAHV